MDLQEFVEQVMKKHNIKVSLEDVLEAIRIEYEEQAKKNKKGNVGVVGLDDATVEAIIIETPAVLEREKRKNAKAAETKPKSVVKTTPKPEVKKADDSNIKADDETKEFLEQLGLWS